MQTKKRPLTLLEIVISLALMSILMTALLGTYRHITLRNRELALLTEETMQRELIRKKLQSLFINVVTASTKNGCSLYLGKGETGNDTLFISYDNGNDHQAAFSGMVDAQIYLNDKKIFCKTEGTDFTVRTEILTENIAELSFSFFDQKGSPQAFWTPEWRENKTYLPAIVKISCDKVDFAFFLPPSFQSIDYPSL